MLRSNQNSVDIRGSSGTQFGVRLEDSEVQFVVATPMEDGRYNVTYESVTAEEGRGFLTESNEDLLTEALQNWADRHDPGSTPIAISLDGDFCVTRVAIEPMERIDDHLRMLQTRVHRYLQLGPGMKSIGEYRSPPNEGTVYAATGVVNRELIQRINLAVERSNLTAAWVEPSLISLARFAGIDPQWSDKTILIADGTGNRWDLGIASEGRLLLDYRPAMATSLRGMYEALKGHFPRLQRFCVRRREIGSGTISTILVFGSESTVAAAVPLLDEFEGITAQLFEVSGQNELFHNQFESAALPAVATVLPRLIGIDISEIADLTSEVRRRTPKLSATSRFLTIAAPLIAASILFVAMLSWVVFEQSMLMAREAGASTIEERLQVIRSETGELAFKAQQQAGYERIDELTPVVDWNRLVGDLTACLPPNARLRSVQLTSVSGILLEGEVSDDATLYDVIGDFKTVPGISLVALKGTEPIEDQIGSRFSVSLELESFRPSKVEAKY